MRLLAEYLSTKVKSSIIAPKDKDNEDELRQIVRSEIERLGKTADLNHIDVSGCTNFSRIFYLRDFQGDISKWDVSSVVITDLMFGGSPNMNLDYLGDLKFDSLKNSSHMFAVCPKFEGKGLSKWDVSNIEQFEYMFANCKAFKEDLSNWRPKSAKSISYMFQYDENFECDLSGWEVSKFCTMTNTFQKSKMNKKYSYWPKRIS